MNQDELHPLEYISVVRRRKWWLIAPVAASVVVGLLLVRFLPKEYRSNATIGVTSPIVSPNLFGTATPFDNQERLRAISQQLLSSQMLARVVQEEGLVPGGPVDPEVARVRKGIKISVPEPVASTSEPRHLDMFVVSYADNEPALAQRVTNRLAAVFVDENAKARAAQAGDASAFIANQLAASQARLVTLDAKLRGAKEAHMGQLPEQTASNLQRVAILRQQIETNATTIRGEQDRLSMTEASIDALAAGNTDAITAVGGADALPSAEGRVLALERQLAVAKTIYTPRHPDVQQLEADLAAARSDAAAERGRAPADRLAQLQLNPAYRRLVADREAIRLRIRDLQRESADAARQVRVYQGRIESAPMVEQELTSLQREYDLERQQYADLSAKQRNAVIAETVVRNGSGEQFTVIYPASFPSEPVRPIPMRVMFVTLLAGCCIGGALVLGREYFDDSVHEARELKDEFDLPVIGSIPQIPA
jgi:polysaccharide chain length determinant protein (PEP-CTERM system associated)